MKTRRITIGRIVFVLAAIAMLTRFTARSAWALDGQTITGRAAADTLACLNDGGSPRAIDSSIYCVFPGGHGWMCEEAGDVRECHVFMVANGVSDKVVLGQSGVGSLQVSQSSGEVVKSAVNIDKSSVTANINKP